MRGSCYCYRCYFKRDETGGKGTSTDSEINDTDYIFAVMVLKISAGFKGAEDRLMVSGNTSLAFVILPLFFNLVAPKIEIVCNRTYELVLYAASLLF